MFISNHVFINIVRADWEHSSSNLQHNHHHVCSRCYYNDVPVENGYTGDTSALLSVTVCIVVFYDYQMIIQSGIISCMVEFDLPNLQILPNRPPSLNVTSPRLIVQILYCFSDTMLPNSTSAEYWAQKIADYYHSLSNYAQRELLAYFITKEVGDYSLVECPMVFRGRLEGRLMNTTDQVFVFGKREAEICIEIELDFDPQMETEYTYVFTAAVGPRLRYFI